MTTRPNLAAVDSNLWPAMLQTFFHLLACAVCGSDLVWDGFRPSCTHCGRSYGLLDSGVLLMLPDETLAYEQDESSRARKAHVIERFATIDRTLPEAHAAFVPFLNLGYVPNDAPQHALRGPERPMLNRFSTKLLFEVLGDCNLDGRVTFEVGCGRGGNLAMIHRYYTPQILMGADLSVSNAEFCQRNHALGCGGFVVADAEHLPFRDQAAHVVLNIESSHYYPHRERFFDEVYRVLASGGDFLYADILSAQTFERAHHYLATIGFAVTRHVDISENVLLSCTAIHQLRESGRRRAFYDTFNVIPGSPEFEALEAGKTRYAILAFRKQ